MALKYMAIFIPFWLGMLALVDYINLDSIYYQIN